MFDVCECTDLTTRGLCELSRDGTSVLKSPHVGNFYPNNLALAQLGVPMVVYDRTFGERDRNFHPHCVIARGTQEQIAPADVIVSHATVLQDSRLAPGWFTPGTYLRTGHLNALRSAIPQARLTLFTDYLMAHRKQVLAMLEASFEEGERHEKFRWERRVTSSGQVVRGLPGTWSRVLSDGIYGVTSAESGWIVPLGHCTLLSTVIEARAFDNSEVIHISGPDMVGYIHKLTGSLDAVYSAVQRGCSWVPSNITLRLVPAAEMRFAVPRSRAGFLDGVIRAYETTRELKRERGERMKAAASNEERRRIIQECDERKGEAYAELQDALRRCPDIFYDISEGRFFSQYDMLAGEELYVPRWALDKSYAEIEQIMNDLRWHRKRAA